MKRTPCTGQQKNIHALWATSPDFFAQGYGMESDERATNAKILRPFDSYGYIQQDTLSNEEKELSSRPDIESQPQP